MNSISKITRDKAAKTPPAETFHLHSSAPLSGHRERLVAKAAYFCAERRGFEPGHELEDWLSAEREIDELLAHTDPSEFLAEAEADAAPEERPG